MKALKLSAVIFTALLALSACKTAPGGGENGNTPGGGGNGNTPGGGGNGGGSSSADAKAQEGLNDALGQVGSVAGLDHYGLTYSFPADDVIAATYMYSSFYLSSDSTKAAFVGVSIADGTGDIGFGKHTFDNDIITKDSGKATLRELTGSAGGATGDYDSDNITYSGTAVTADVLAGYKFYEVSGASLKFWESTLIEGNGTWENGGGNSAPLENKYLGIKKSGNKIIVASLSIDIPNKNLSFTADPADPDAENTFTKK